MTDAYYNENDPKAAAWLRQLIKAGLIAGGDVDVRSIADVGADDVRGYSQCHFFAGIGGWSLALRLAGWPDDRAVWTGSCPCQPFSAAGKRRGTADERHLWPEFHRLIAERAPPVVFGEQVASKDGRLWLAGVRADLEALGYAVGAADLCAAGVGAPHIRQRLCWMGHAKRAGLEGRSLRECGRAGERIARPPGDVVGMADADEERCNWLTDDGATSTTQHASDRERIFATWDARQLERHSDFWADAEWLPCTDGRARRIEPGTFPLAHGVPARVGRLRGYGNAIVPQVAAEFIGAHLDD